MSLKQTTVTVIVPVYNVQNYLEKCVRSILAQTFSDFELILVDDGSTDESPRICDQFAQADSRITVIHKQNGGLSSARNAALDIAQGKYIAFIDSDDYVEPRLLEKTVAALEAGNYDWCAYGMRKEDTQGNLLEPVCFKPRTLRIENEQERMAFYDHVGLASRSLRLQGQASAVLLGADGMLAGGPVEGVDEVTAFVDDIAEEIAEALSV